MGGMIGCETGAPPNQSMKPTQHFVITSSTMQCFCFKVLGGLSLSR